jgi:BRCT domain type II-containing protein
MHVMSAIKGKRIVFTGTLVNMSRTDAQNRAKALGAIVGSAVNAATDLLVAGPGAGSKMKAALKNGVKVINEAQWQAMAGGGGDKVAKKVAKKASKKVAKKVAKKATKKVAKKATKKVAKKAAKRSARKA